MDVRTRNAVMHNALWQTLELNQFGWVNCDRFQNLAPSEITQLGFTIPASDGVEHAMVYLLFKNLNSVMQSSYLNTGGEVEAHAFDKIPRGCPTRMIAVSERNGQTVAASYDLTTGQAEAQVIAMKRTERPALRKMFSLK